MEQKKNEVIDMQGYMTEDELYHYGIKGMKWGVRRYTNPDGSLTEAGKKRQAKQDASDERYRQSQLRKTERYYNSGHLSGLYGSTFRPGIEGLNTRAKKAREKYKQTGNEKYNQRYKNYKAKLATKRALKNIEMKKIKELDHEGIMKERAAVGRSVATDILMTAGATAILAPTTGIRYFQFTSAQDAISRHRLSGIDRNNVGK